MINSEIESKIIEQFNELADGDKIKFKRSCGKMLNEVDAETLMLFYRITIGKSTQWEENRVFLAVCIQALSDCTQEERMGIDQAVLEYRKSAGEHISENFYSRIVKLLDTEWDEQGFLAGKITRLAKLLRQKGYSLNGISVMEDLIHWNDVSRSIQKRWVRTMSSI